MEVILFMSSEWAPLNVTCVLLARAQEGHLIIQNLSRGLSVLVYPHVNINSEEILPG